MPSKLEVRSKILQAGKKLTKENIDDLKYLLKDDIGEGVLEHLNTGVDLLRELEKNGIYTVEDLSGLKQCLQLINRDDINAFIENRESSRIF